MANGAVTISVEEAAEMLGIGRGLAFRLAREGKIPAWRLGKRLRVCRPALETILNDPHQAARLLGRKKRAAA